MLTTYQSWADFEISLQKSYEIALQVTPRVKAKATELTRSADKPEEKLRALYNFVSKEMHTVDLPLDSAGFRPRPAESILSSGYAVPDEKCVLLSALATSLGLRSEPTFTLSGTYPTITPPVPSLLRHPLVLAHANGRSMWLDPSVEVAPFGMIASNMRGRPVVPLYPSTDTYFLEDVPKDLPFPGSQHVKIDATLGADGKLTAKVHYAMRGDNELLLRVAFHKAPKNKWKDVAQLLSLSDGFRGQIINVTASDPYTTKEPFTVEYEISQPKFVDWSKKLVRIPAVLPLVGLPDPPAKTAPGAAASPIDLGTPLDVEARFTMHLPSGTIAAAPTGTSVQRDYASFSSSYSTRAATIFASRHLHFLLREIPAARAADYNAFIRAVQNDETQGFTLERAETSPPKTNSAAPSNATPPKPNPAKP